MVAKEEGCKTIKIQLNRIKSLENHYIANRSLTNKNESYRNMGMSSNLLKPDSSLFEKAPCCRHPTTGVGLETAFSIAQPCRSVHGTSLIMT